MASVLVVSRNAHVGVALVHHGYEVADIRPDRHGDWTQQAREADVVVLELTDAVAAEAAVLRLRAEGVGVPVLVVSNAQPGWDTAAAHLGAGTALLPLPISLPQLVQSLDELVAGGPVDPAVPPQNEEELLNAVAASVGLSITENGTVVQGGTGPAAVPLVDVPPADEPVAEEPVAEPVAEEPVAEPVAEEPVAEPAPEPAPPRRTAMGDADVAHLLDWAREVTGVAECAEVVSLELAERLAADAAALLLPDGEEWRVAGGTGLRPLEHRARLAADHWLVAHVVRTGDGLVAADFDAARDEVVGAPLASWPRLLAVAVPEVGGLFLAARAGEPFDADALTVAQEVGREAAPLLTDALAVRALARMLAPYADLPDD